MNSQIRDIKFAPKHVGLVLAVACTDGTVKFYKPTVPTDLSDWQEPFNELRN